MQPAGTREHNLRAPHPLPVSVFDHSVRFNGSSFQASLLRRSLVRSARRAGVRAGAYQRMFWLACSFARFTVRRGSITVCLGYTHTHIHSITHTQSWDLYDPVAGLAMAESLLALAVSVKSVRFCSFCTFDPLTRYFMASLIYVLS